MTLEDIDDFSAAKITSYRKNKRYEYKYPETKEQIRNLLKQINQKKQDGFNTRYNYTLLAEYCLEVLGFKNITRDGLRRVIQRIAKENNCEL